MSSDPDIESIVNRALLQQAKVHEAERDELLRQQAANFEAVLSGLQVRLDKLTTNESPAKSETLANTSTPLSEKISNKFLSTPSPSPASRRRHPSQLRSDELPKDFKGVKEALYVHIKVLWGMLEQHAVPPKVDEAILEEFYRQYSTSDEIEETLSDPGARELISRSDIRTLEQGRAGLLRLGRGLSNVQEMHILYVQGILAKVGIRCWGPNLEESPDSLFNSACRIVALNTFRQLAAGGAYRHTNMNLSYINNLSLLIAAYDHYVHYLLANRYKMEMKDSGRFQRIEVRKNAQKRRERLRQARHAFAMENKFPERYIKVLENLNAHSDDEFCSEENVYKIKTLKYRSKNANKFMRRLDAAMAPSRGAQHRIRVRDNKDKSVSTFIKPPWGLPLDFYRPRWFNDLSDYHRRNIPDLENVAFLPDASQSLLPRAHPDEKLSDADFTDKHRDDLTGLYEIPEDDEEDEDSESSSHHGYSTEIDYLTGQGQGCSYEQGDLVYFSDEN